MVDQDIQWFAEFRYGGEKVVQYHMEQEWDAQLSTDKLLSVRFANVFINQFIVR